MVDAYRLFFESFSQEVNAAMEFEMKDLPGQATRTAAGAAVNAVQAGSDPGGTIRRTTRRLQKKGEPVSRQIERGVQANTSGAAAVLRKAADSATPEKVMLAGLGYVRKAAARRDLVGEVASSGLRVLNGGLGLANGSLGIALKTLNRLESASKPPSRGSRTTGAARRGEASARNGGRRTTTSRRRTTRRSSRTTASSRTA